ncbi:MAG: hypothetical protein AB8B74_14095 [Crocinitomicaceae bacterium]
MKKISLIISIALLAISFVSCKKNGCTDPDALNFEDKVKSNNLLCLYEGSVTFWYDAIKEDSLRKLYGIKSLEYYVNKIRIDSLPFSNANAQEKAPRCGKSEIASFTDSLGAGYKKWIQYDIRTETGLVLYDSFVELTANQCLKIRLD